MTRSPRIILAAAAVAAVAAVAAAVAVPSLMAKPAATDRAVTPAAAAGTTIYACLTSRHTLVKVIFTTPPACPVGTVPVQLPGHAWPPGPTPSAPPAIRQVTSARSRMMNPQGGTDAEAGYDLWLSNHHGPNEIMIWVANAGPGSGGAPQIGTATIGGQAFPVYQYGGGEVIFSLDHN